MGENQDKLGGNNMKYDFRKVSDNDVQDFLNWKYEGVYSLYDNDRIQGKIDWIRGLPEEDKAFSVYNGDNELIGHCEIYIGEKTTLSVQMRPCLTGKGMGKEFLQAFLEFVVEKYNLKSIELIVAKFNERATKLYKNLGFVKVKEYSARTSAGSDIETEFLVMEKHF